MQLVCNKIIKIKGGNNLMVKNFKVFFVVPFLFLIFLSCTSSTSAEGNSKLKIVSSLNPNYNLVKYIAQDKVENYLLPFSSDSHNFEFKPSDVKNIEDADAVFYIGLSIDDKILDLSKDKNKFVKTTEGASLIKLNESDSHNHDGYIYDPHVWLSLKEYIVMGKNVLDALVKLDPENADFYNKNYEDFLNRANSMYETYKKDFDTLINKEFLSNHDSYGYLARDFGLVNSSLYDIANHGELNLQGMISAVENKNIKLILGDKNSSNSELEVISNALNSQYKLVSNLEVEGDYFTEYEMLLSSIYDGLR